MSEAGQQFPSAARPVGCIGPVGPGLRTAQRIVQAAELAAAAGHTGLTWTALRQWPAWAGTGQPSPAWLRTLGACWHAAELQQCIDGARLNMLCEDLGAQALQQVLQLDTAATDDTPLAPPLPMAVRVAGIDAEAAAEIDAETAARWREALAAAGRRVALASLEDADLRAAVAASLGWQDRPAEVPAARALSWLSTVSTSRP